MIHHPHSFNRTDFPPMAIALGFFDGVHKGHQEVILTAREIANNKHWKSAVMTFLIRTLPWFLGIKIRRFNT